MTRPVIFLLNSDEETGSNCSRALIESLARKCASVFVLEPAQGLPGAYKTARKGVANYRLQVHGVAAHSGVDFSHGHSAVLELGRQIERASAFTNQARGITVNAGVIGGGTRSNVVAAEAWAEFDVRIAKAVDAQRLDRRFRVSARDRPPMHAGDHRRPESAADGTHPGYGLSFPPRSNHGRRIGFSAAGSSDGRRFGREFYFCPGNPNAGWNGSGRRRRTCRPGIHSARRARSQNSTAGSDDWRPGVGIGRKGTTMLAALDLTLLAIFVLCSTQLLRSGKKSDRNMSALATCLSAKRPSTLLNRFWLVTRSSTPSSRLATRASGSPTTLK